MNTSIHLGELTWPEVAGLTDAERTPVLLLPVGAVEPHGPHSPLVTDVIISLGMCERAAHVFADDPGVRVLVLPPLTYGVTRYAAAFPGTVGIGERTLTSLVVELCVGLIDQGFRHVVIVNNHLEPEHRAALRRAVDTVASERAVRIGYPDITRRSIAERLGDEFRSGASHAGRYETSLVLADRPDLVDRDVLTTLPARPVNMPEAIAAGRTDFVAMGMDQAYCGAPAESSAEEGEATFVTLTQIVVEAIRDIVSG